MTPRVVPFRSAWRRPSYILTEPGHPTLPIAGRCTDGIDHTGDLGLLEELTRVLVEYDRDFPIVTP